MDLFDFFNKKKNSKNVAKDRLKLVLVHDRANTSTHVLEMIRTDILKVISNYMEIDEAELEMDINKNVSENNPEGLPVLYANIPIKNMRKNLK